MNAKDKEKLKVAGTIVSFMNSDPIIIDPEEFRKRADIKNKEFYEVEKDVKAEDEIDESETLSCDIIIRIADKTAERFEDMADGMEMSTLKQLV